MLYCCVLLGREGLYLAAVRDNQQMVVMSLKSGKSLDFLGSLVPARLTVVELHCRLFLAGWTGNLQCQPHDGPSLFYVHLELPQLGCLARGESVQTRKKHECRIRHPGQAALAQRP